MAEESHSDALALVRTLDDTRDIGHHERLVVIVAYDTEVRLESSERIVSNFRTSSGNCREQGRLTCIREAHKSHVSEQLELEDEPAFLVWLARLRVARCLVGRCLEVVVSETSAAALHEDPLLMRLHELEKDLAGLSVLCNSSERHVQIYVRAILAVLQLAAAGSAVLGHDVLAVFQMDECPELRIGPEDDMSASSAVSTVRSTLRNILLPPHVRRTRTSIA